MKYTVSRAETTDNMTRRLRLLFRKRLLSFIKIILLCWLVKIRLFHDKMINFAPLKRKR